MYTRLPVAITRPQAQSESWQTAMQRYGDIHRKYYALPLMAITPVTEIFLRQRIQHCWQELEQFHAAVFVSPSAVKHFFDSAPSDAVQTWRASGLRAWAVGPGTRLALLKMGLDAACIDSPTASADQYDSEALWLLIKQQLIHCVNHGKKILRIRGTDRYVASSETAACDSDLIHNNIGTGRDWLGCAVEQAGVALETIVVYQRQLPQWNALQRETARQLAHVPAVWLFSSALALRHLSILLPHASWHAAIALTTHARIAQKASMSGFKQVITSRPTLMDVVQSLQSCP